MVATQSETAMTIQVFLVLTVAIVLVSSQRTTTQVAYGVCVQNKLTNTLQLDFRLDRNTDPLGTMWALTSSLSRDTSCTFQSSSSGNGGVWSVTSTVNLDNNVAASNGCSFSTESTTSGRTFTWRFLYLERSDRTDIDAGLNRQYTVTCNPSNIVGNDVMANIVPSTPNLPQNVNPYIPVVTLSILRQTTSGAFTPLSNNDQIPIGTQLKLRLSYNYGTYDNKKYYGVAGLRTLFGRTAAFSSPITFFNDNGCKASTYAPTTAFVKTSNGANDPVGSRVFVQDTGSFPIWIWDNSPNMFIKVYYRFCHGSTGFDSVTLCNDPCATLSGTTGRRRRQDEDLSQLNSTVVQIRVYDPDLPTEQLPAVLAEESKDIVYVLIGACVVVGVILVVMLVVIACVVNGTRKDKERRQKQAHINFQNKIPY